MTNHDLQTLLAIDRTTLPPDGGPLYNRLIFSHSPYLLQHARNPVDWREWGPETLQEARQRNLPLFVSIGYATCHWCHVMAHESFEDDEVADILNHGFVPVKVDREERPDLDEFCMAACQTMTGSGGWPLNCFLKPDGTPFYALTYLPKEPRRGMPGFLELLENIAQVWRHKPDSVERNATSLMQALQRLSTPPQPERFMTLPELCKQAADTLRRIYDQQYGGFGTAPKFPMPPTCCSCYAVTILFCATWPCTPCDPCGRAASGTNWPAAFTATAPTDTGWCPTSKRCSMTRPW